MSIVYVNDAELSAIGDSIRTKKGVTDKFLLSEMPEAIESITTGADTSDATAVAGDIVSPKTAYIGSGKVVGTLEESDRISGTVSDMPSGAVSGSYLFVSNAITERKCLEANGKIQMTVTASNFGNCSSADVKSGLTFTSQNGIKINGTMENGSTKEW